MPYKMGTRLPGEKASKLGHLEVIKSPLVKKLCEDFENPEYDISGLDTKWQELPKEGTPLNIIFSSDGSIQILESKQPPYKALSFIKTALFKMDQYALSKLDKESPNPFSLKDIMEKSALFHSTVLPLRHVKIEGKNLFNAIREIIFESIKDKGLNDSLDGALMDTLKWLSFDKWRGSPKSQLERFGCPHCGENEATLPLDAEQGHCPFCNETIYITDSFGLHQNMQDEFAPNQVANDYMSIAETLMIFTPIKYFWENNREILKNCLFIKDGPLSLRATLAKFTAPIQRFFRFAQKSGYPIAMLGQEKSGVFFEHLELIAKDAKPGSVFIPDNTYIRDEIQHSNLRGTYGEDTNYGAKVLVKYNDYHHMVLNVPTGVRGEFVRNPDQKQLIRFNDIIATLPSILSNRFEGALLPIELANGVASLSTYPSAKTLELFAEDLRKK